jgi:hypothetical protein
MKTYIRLDFYLQLIVLIIGLFITFKNEDYIIYIYLIVGVFQLSSALVHFFLVKDRSEDRRLYEKTLQWIFGIALTSYFISLLTDAGFFCAIRSWSHGPSYNIWMCHLLCYYLRIGCLSLKENLVRYMFKRNTSFKCKLIRFTNQHLRLQT